MREEEKREIKIELYHLERIKIGVMEQDQELPKKAREAVAKKVRDYYRLTRKKKSFNLGIDLIETAGKRYNEEELINATEAVLDGWWTEGRFARQFSSLLKNYLGVKLCLLTNSGSSANLIAFFSLTSPLLKKRKIKPGDEVITVAATFPTTLNPIIQAGCLPVFIDVDLITMNIDCSRIEEAINRKTKAIFIAHTQGNPFNLTKIKKIARKYNLWLIEDCCDALGAEYEGKKVGAFGDLATFSFYPAHQITMGEGGAVVTNNPHLYKAAQSFRDWGRDCWCAPGKDNTCRRRFGWKLGRLPFGYDHKFIYSHLGYNLKLTDMQAAIGVAQIKKIDQFVKKRRENYLYLRKNLEKYKKFFQFQEAEENSNPSWFGFMLTLKDSCKFTRNEMVFYLNSKKIATRNLYAGNITLHPYIEKVKYKVVGKLKNTNKIMSDTFWIGVHPNLTRKQMDYIIGTIGGFLDEKS